MTTTYDTAIIVTDAERAIAAAEWRRVTDQRARRIRRRVNQPRRHRRPRPHVQGRDDVHER